MRRRTLLKTTALLPFGARVVSAAPPPESITPALVEAARKEGKVSYYTAMDLSVAEPLAKAFEAKYPGIKVAVERTGAERLFNRIAQETASNIRRADVVNSSDAAHFISWKRQDWLQPYVTVEIAENVPAEQRDPDGAFVNQRTHLSAIAYNASLIKPEDAPKGFIDLLDPKYAGKLVKGHPGYSGTIMTATHQLVRELGWGYFEKLAKQKVLQVQSATEPPKKIEARWRRRRRQRLSVLDAKSAAPHRSGACGRRHAADLQSHGGVQGGAQSQRRSAHAPDWRRVRPKFIVNQRPVSGQQLVSPAAQADASIKTCARIRRGREDGRRDQGSTRGLRV
jgi:hypothetical protein